MQSKVEKLTPRAMMFLALAKAKGNGNSCDYYEFDRLLHFPSLQQAVYYALLAHPRTQCRLVRRWPHYYWKHVPLDPDLLPLEKRTLKAKTYEGFLAEMENDIWERPVDPFTESPVQFLYYEWRQEGIEKSFLQILSSHLVSDAKSSFQLAHDLTRFYGSFEQMTMQGSEEFTAPLPFPKPQSCQSFQDSQLFLRHLSWKKKCLLLIKGGSLVLKDLLTPVISFGPIKSNTEGTENVVFERMETSPELLELLLKASRKKSVTLHCLLTQGLLETGRSFLRQEGKLKIMDTLTLRPYSHENTESMYDLLMTPYPLSLDSRLPLPELPGKTLGLLKELKGGKFLEELFRHKIYAFLIGLFPLWALPFMVKLMGKLFVKSSLILTNTGPIPYDLERMGKAQILQFYPFSVCFPPGRLALIFTTLKDRLRLTMVTDSSFFANGPLNDFGRPLEKKLLELAHKHLQ